MNVQCVGGTVGLHTLHNIPTWGYVGMNLVRMVYHPVSDVVRITPRIVTGISTLLLEVS